MQTHPGTSGPCQRRALCAPQELCWEPHPETSFNIRKDSEGQTEILMCGWPASFELLCQMHMFLWLSPPSEGHRRVLNYNMCPDTFWSRLSAFLLSSLWCCSEPLWGQGLAQWRKVSVNSQTSAAPGASCCPHWWTLARDQRNHRAGRWAGLLPLSL